MYYDYDPDLKDLREVAASFAQKEIAPHASQWSRDGAMPPEVFYKLGELGLMGMLMPEEYGGADAGYVAYVTVMEQIGRADQSVAAAWNAHSTIGSLPIAEFGTSEQKERWLRPLAEGTALAAFGLTEAGAGSDAAGISTRAVRTDMGWVLNGSKMFISNAGTPMSQGVCVLARTGEVEHKRFAVFYVPTGTPGYSTAPKLEKVGWHALDTRELIFENCELGDEHIIGAEGAGLRQFLSVLDGGRISVAALALSLAIRAQELAVQHAKERHQFGQPLAAFQAIAHKFADMEVEIAAARGLVYQAAWLADNGKPFAREAAIAKLHASEMANRVVSQSVQIHGGYGFMLESEISRFFLDSKILEIGEGTSEVQRNVIAKHVLAGNMTSRQRGR